MYGKRYVISCEFSRKCVLRERAKYENVVVSTEAREQQRKHGLWKHGDSKYIRNSSGVGICRTVTRKMGLCIAGMIASMAHRGNPRGYVLDIHLLSSYFLSGFLLLATLFHSVVFAPWRILDMQAAPIQPSIAYLNGGLKVLLLRHA